MRLCQCANLGIPNQTKCRIPWCIRLLRVIFVNFFLLGSRKTAIVMHCVLKNVPTGMTSRCVMGASLAELVVLVSTYLSSCQVQSQPSSAWTVFHLSLYFITFGGYFAHLAKRIHKEAVEQQLQQLKWYTMGKAISCTHIWRMRIVQKWP